MYSTIAFFYIKLFNSFIYSYSLVIYVMEYKKCWVDFIALTQSQLKMFPIWQQEQFYKQIHLHPSPILGVEGSGQFVCEFIFFIFFLGNTCNILQP